MESKQIISNCCNELKSSNASTLFTLDGTICAAKISKVYDGDSFYMNISFHNKIVAFKCRLNGIDTPELRGGTVREKRLALIARDRVRELVDGKIVCVTCGKFEKYGRVLVSVVLDDGTNLRDILIKEGLGFAYDGTRKRTDWETLESKYQSYNQNP